MTNYNYLIVGAGLFGSVFAHEAKKKGKSVLVIEKGKHIAGNCYSHDMEGIHIHAYGPHIFHTDKKEVWDYINQFGEFNNFICQPVARVGTKVYNLPFNMNLFSKVFKVTTPKQAKEAIEYETTWYEKIEPKNLEEQALKMIGKTLYDMFVKEYTEKQWGKPCTDLPADTIKRLPLRFTYDNNYFNDRYQGIPIKGYTQLIENMLEGIEVRLETEYKKGEIEADTIIYTGKIDQYFDYVYGRLEYRSLSFEHKVLQEENHQGAAVINYPEKKYPYTRMIEHKHFTKQVIPHTVVTKEYPLDYISDDQIPYYPIGNRSNLAIYEKYRKLTEQDRSIIFGGRLGSYRYNDMDDTIEQSLELASKILYG